MNATPIDIPFIAAGIANAKATVILEDEQSGFYIATSGSGVSYFQPDLPRWQTFTEVDGLANPDIRSMLKTQSNNIWFGTANGTSQYCPKSRTWTSLFISDGLPNNSIWSLLEDSEQNIWFGTNGGGIAVLRKNAKLSSLSSTDWTIYNTSNGLIGDNINALHQDKLGNIWVGTKQGASCFDSRQNNWVNYLKNTSINSITSDKNNTVWFATNRGLISYNKPENQWQTYTTESGLGSNTVQTLSYSEAGGLWAGTRNGISQYIENSKASSTSAFKTLTQQDGLTDNMVWGLFQDAKSNLWIATWGGGVSLYSPEKETWKTYTTPSEFADTYTMSVIKSGTKHVWIGTWGAISRYDLENGQWLTLSSADNLPNNNVQCLAQLRENEVWVGAYGGLIHYNVDTQQWHFFTKDDGLTSNNVTTLFADKNNNQLYIGTDHGLCVLSEQDSTITPIYEEQFAQSSLSAITSDSCNKLWIATTTGLFQQTEQSGWIHYSQNQGLPSQQITAIAIDNEETVWAGTDKGLCYQQQNSPEFKSFESLSTQVNSLVISKNTLWIADNNGILYRLDGSGSELLPINAFGSDPLTSLAMDEQDNLWVASQGGGAFWLTLHGKAAGYLQNFTAGAQNFATEFAVQSPWILAGRPEAIAATQLNDTADAITMKAAHRPYLSVAQHEEKSFIWVGSDEDGLYIAPLETQHAVITPCDESRVTALPSRHITALSSPVAEQLWVGTSSGLARVNQKTLSTEKIHAYPEIPTGPINALASNNENTTLVAFNKINKAQFQDKSAAAEREKTSLWLLNDGVNALKLNGEEVSDVQNSNVLTLCAIDSQTFWLGTDAGLFSLCLHSHQISRINALASNTSVSKIELSHSKKVAILAFDESSAKPAIFYAEHVSSPLTELPLPTSLANISNIAFDNHCDTLYACVGSNIFKLNSK